MSDLIITPGETFKELTRIQSKLDRILENLERLDDEYKDIDNRLKSVERKQTFWAGGIAALSIALGLISRKLGELFFG